MLHLDDPVRTIEVDSLSQFASAFATRMHLTKGALYAGHKRLNRKSEISHVSISMLSIYALAASLFSLFIVNHTDLDSTKYINFAVLTLSAFILFLNSFEFGRRYDHRAHKQYATAEEISYLCNRLECSIRSNTLTPEYVKDCMKEYRDILSRTESGVADIDFFYFLFGQKGPMPQRHAYIDAEIEEKFGSYEILGHEKQKIVDDYIRVTYERSKFKYNDKLSQYMKVQFNRWIDINFSMIAFVIFPAIMLPLGYFIMFKQKELIDFISTLTRNNMEILRYFVVILLYFIPLSWAIYRILRGRSVFVLFEISTYYAFISSLLYVLVVHNAFDAIFYLVTAMTLIVLLSKPLRLKVLGKTIGKWFFKSKTT